MRSPFNLGRKKGELIMYYVFIWGVGLVLPGTSILLNSHAEPSALIPVWVSGAMKFVCSVRVLGDIFS